MVTDLSFTPKSIDDINDDFLKNMKAKYTSQDNENKNPSSKNLPRSSAQKDRAGKKELTPFDEVRPVVVIDEKNNTKITNLTNLKKEKQEPKRKDKDVSKSIKSEEKKEIKSQKTQPQNKETPKKADKKSAVIEKPVKHAEAPIKAQNKAISDIKTQGIKQPVKKDSVQKKAKINTEPAQDKEIKKEHTVPKNESLKEKPNSSEAKEHKGDIYNNYFEEFLGILSTPQKEENKKAVKHNTQLKSLLEELDGSKEDEKTKFQQSKKNDKKASDNPNKREQNVQREENYDKVSSSNSNALIAKAKSLRKLFLAGCILLVCSVLSIAILFTMSRFIPGKEIVEQNKNNEQVVEVNDEGDSNEMIIKCSYVESYSFSAFINTYYLHWVIVFSLILLGASIVFFSLYVRERGAGSILKFIKSKKRKE